MSPLPRVNRFFGGAAPAGAVPVRSAAISPSPKAAKKAAEPRRESPFSVLGEDAAFVLVDDVAVPRFSKMVKNMGLDLLDRRRTAAGQAPSSPSAQTSQQSGPRLFQPSQTAPQPMGPPANNQQRPVSVLPVPTVKKESTPAPSAVQGFRVVGDRTNRIVFLNLADLGLSPGTPSLRLGDQELVPIDGLSSTSAGLLSSSGTSVESPRESFSGRFSASSDRLSALEPASTKADGFRDALAKMSTTHQQG